MIVSTVGNSLYARFEVNLVTLLFRMMILWAACFFSPRLFGALAGAGTRLGPPGRFPTGGSSLTVFPQGVLRHPPPPHHTGFKGYYPEGPLYGKYPL